jgi:hypothetical protein
VIDKKPRKAANSCEIREQFSELQAEWRGDRHSNPQSPFEERTFHEAAAFLEIWPGKAYLKVISPEATTAPNEHA